MALELLVSVWWKQTVENLCFSSSLCVKWVSTERWGLEFVHLDPCSSFLIPEQRRTEMEGSHSSVLMFPSLSHGQGCAT